MIRRMTCADIERVGEIWLESSIKAHDFVPEDFWRSQLTTMTEKLLPDSESYVYTMEARVIAFITMGGDFVHCLFVGPREQRCGAGSSLLSYVKDSHQTLRLNIYQKNHAARRFYEGQGFVVTGESACEQTGCAEFSLEWRRDPEPADAPD